MRYDALDIVELHIPVSELESPVVGRYLGVFVGSEAEDEANLDEVDHAPGKSGYIYIKIYMKTDGIGGWGIQ